MKTGRIIQIDLGFDMQNMLCRFVLSGCRQEQEGPLPKSMQVVSTVRGIPHAVWSHSRQALGNILQCQSTNLVPASTSSVRDMLRFSNVQQTFLLPFNQGKQ